MRAILRLATLSALVTACQSYRPVILPAESHLPQDPHIEVRVTEKSGVQSRLVETRVEHDSVIGRNFVTGELRQAIAMSDIVGLEIGEPDNRRTMTSLAVFGVLTGLILLGLIIG